jgi:hypothetical protein
VFATGLAEMTSTLRQSLAKPVETLAMVVKLSAALG